LLDQFFLALFNLFGANSTQIRLIQLTEGASRVHRPVLLQVTAAMAFLSCDNGLFLAAFNLATANTTALTKEVKKKKKKKGKRKKRKKKQKKKKRTKRLRPLHPAWTMGHGRHRWLRHCFEEKLPG
jgi:hypothetical protein